jgi:predicted nucleic acid-binding protein
MRIFVLDTNIVTYYLKNNRNVIDAMKIALAMGNKIFVAPIAYYEIKRGLLFINAKRMLKEFQDICDSFGVGEMDNNILETAVDIYVELRKKGRPTEDADIFIAAYCRYHGFTLVTNNIKHFHNIDGLDVIDWSV